MSLRYDPAADAGHLATTAGLSLTELAVGLGVARERARLLVEPFIVVGVVQEQDGLLIVVDPEISAAFQDREDGL